MLQPDGAPSAPQKTESRALAASRPTPPLPLTVLAGAGDFERLLERQSQRSRRDREPLSALRLNVALLDDELSAKQSAALLDECARRLCNRVRSTDTVLRWQDTQFGVLLLGCSPTCAPAVQIRLARAVGETYSLVGRTLRLRLQGELLTRPGG